MLKLIYSAGLRLGELANLKIGDIDWLRMLIHIRRGKGRKDRYVCLSKYILSDMKLYLQMEKPFLYLFNNSKGNKLGQSTISKIMQRAVKKAGISKEGVCLHTLRHSFATHLLEEGLDIISIKELLGHEKLHTTMVYLHVTDYRSELKKRSPLDQLYCEEAISDQDHGKIVKELIEITAGAVSHEKINDSQLSLNNEFESL
jgi:site-specific recombinase XerD